MNSIKNKYKGYDSMLNECSFDKWILNPERCPASKKYKKQLDTFIKQTIEESNNKTKIELKTLQERIKSNESKNLYPIINHDFDYKTAMTKEYNIYNQGITNEPTIQNLIDTPLKLKSYLNILVKNKYPNEGTVAGVSDIINENKELVKIKQKYKDLNSTLPYPSFRKDYPECKYPTKGKHSASYFIKTGICPTKIKNKQECLDKEYIWTPSVLKLPQIAKDLLNFKKKFKKNKDKNKNKIKNEPGSCNKPRFSYIDNESKGFYGKNGLAPSIFKNLTDIAPDKLFNILAGYSVNGSGSLPCIEEFNNKKNSISKSFLFKICMSAVCIVAIYLLFIPFYR